MKWRKQITQAVNRHSDRIMDLERFYYGIDNPAEQGIDQRLDALENKVSALMATRPEAELPECETEPQQTPAEDAAEWRDLYTEEHRKLGEAEAALEELREAYDFAQYKLEMLAHEQVYQGNSVYYWHDKAKTYEYLVDDINDILHAAGKQHDDEKNTGDLIKELVAERDEALALLREGMSYLPKSEYWWESAERKNGTSLYFNEGRCADIANWLDTIDALRLYEDE